MYYFTDDCLIGVEAIDNEHRELFRIINDTQELLDNQIIFSRWWNVWSNMQKNIFSTRRSIWRPYITPS